MKQIILALSIGALAPSAALAQKVDDPQETVVEGLVVNARLPGPAWWKVTDEDTTLYILGVPPALPRGEAWDRSVLNKRLKGAFAYIRPPRARTGLGDVPALLTLRKALLAEHPLEQQAPALALRLSRAWINAYPRSPKTWRDWKPLGAALLLGGKVYEAAGMDDNQPQRAIEGLARQNRVRIRTSATYRALPIMTAVARQHSETAGVACLQEVLDDIDQGPEVDRMAVRAWAEGEVRAALTTRRGVERCSLLLPGVPALLRQMDADEVATLVDVMKTPGHAVAIYPLRSLVAEDGVLDQLEARGYTINTPADPSP